MSLPQVFHHPILTAIWAVTYAIWVIPEMILSRRLRSGKDAQKQDRGSKLVVILAVNAGIACGFFAAFRLPHFSGIAHWEVAFALGIAVWLAGITLRLYSIHILGRYFTYDVAITQGQQVVEEGPYRWLRHPSYLGGLLAQIGFGMTLTNWLAILLPACCILLGYAYRIPIEEQALVRGLGPSYSNYMRRTKRLIPFVY